MKFTAEVVAALQTLRNNAQNDFELHRLDVLERDLTNPPVAEVVDETHQKFDGVTYHKTPDGQNRVYGHYVTGIGIQRAIWQYYYGEVPDGYVVHHTDEDKSNNDISNLQCLSALEHSQIHYSKGKPVAKNVKRKFVCEVCGREYEAVDVGLNRYCSEKCRDKAYEQRRCVERACVICGKSFCQSRSHDAKTCSTACAAKLREQTKQTQAVPAKCPVCGKEFMRTTRATAYCSDDCKNKAQQARCRETRICVICGKEFVTDKYKPAQTCSKSCGSKLRYQNHVPVPKTETRICVVCGKEFEMLKRKSTQTCSRHCAHVLQHQTMKNQAANSVEV